MICSLILNAGGQSRRMGQSKALLPVPASGLLLFAHMLQRLQALPFDRVIVVTNQPELADNWGVMPPITFVPDDQPGLGPLGGMVTGLALCQEWAAVLACDLPLVNPDVVQLLTDLAQQRDSEGNFMWQAVVPQVNGYEQPLHALYHRSLLPLMQARLTQGERQARSLLAAVRTRWVTDAEIRPVDPELHSFYNVNTPAEWREACRLLAKEMANR